MTGNTSINLEIIAKAYEELAEAEANKKEDVNQCAGFPHVRLSPERAQYYSERLQGLVDDILSEAPDPNGKVYSILVSVFTAPDYIQGVSKSAPLEPMVDHEGED